MRNFPARRLRNRQSTIARENAWWDDHLTRTAVPLLEIWYEDLEQDPQSQVDRVADFLGVRSAVVRPEAVEVTKQRDEVTAAWRERYLAEVATQKNGGG